MHSRRRSTAALAAFLLLAAGACSDSSQPTGLPQSVASVRVRPGQQSLLVGESMQLEAAPLASDGRELSGRSVTWTSSDNAVATVTVNGLVEAKDAGPVTITATSEGKTGHAQITVTKIPIASMTVNVSELSLELGDTHALVASPRDAAGNALPDRVCIWLSTDPLAATLTPTGLQTATVTAYRTASVTLTARCEGKSADVPVTITPLKVARIVPSIEAVNLEVGQTYQLTAIAYDKHGAVLTGREAVWTTTNGAVATVGSQGLVEAKGEGLASIMVTIGEKSAPVGVAVREMPAYDLVYHTLTPSGSELRMLSLRGNAVPQRFDVSDVAAPPGAYSPTARPDGGRIAFAAFTRDAATGQLLAVQIFAADRTGANKARLTDAPQSSDEPVWSPDGTKIAFARGRPGGMTHDIWVMNADGTNEVNLTADASASIDNRMPAWSPDSRQIAFARSENVGFDHPGQFGIWVIDARDGSGKRRLVGAGGFDLWPSWSPDGRRIAFIRDGDPTHGNDVMIVNVDGTGLVRIAVPGYQESTAWSPDGALIAFASLDPVSEGMELYTVRADGSDIRRRTTNAGWGGGRAPKWIARR